VIPDAVPPAGEPPLRDHGANRVAVGARPIPRPQDDRRSRLRVFEPSLDWASERYLPRVHHVEDGDLMAAMPKEAQGFQREGAVEQEIGDEHDEPAAAQLLHDPAERRLRRGPEPWLERGDRLEKLVPVTETDAWRKDDTNIVIESDEAGRVALAKQDQRKRGNEALRVRELREDSIGCAGPRHGAADVAHDHRPEVGLLLELLHVQAIVAAQDFPVYVPNVVTRLIHSVLGKLDGKSTAGGTMKAGEEPLDHSLGHHLDPSELRDLEGIEQIETAGRGQRGHKGRNVSGQQGEINASTVIARRQCDSPALAAARTKALLRLILGRSLQLAHRLLTMRNSD
jgi:hypothetical protein